MTNRRSNNYLIKYALKQFEIAKKKRLKTFKTLKRLKPGAKKALKLQCTVFPYKKRKNKATLLSMNCSISSNRQFI